MSTTQMSITLKTAQKTYFLNVRYGKGTIKLRKEYALLKSKKSTG